MVILSGSPDPLAGFPAHDDDSGSPQATLVQLRAWLMRHDFAPGTRLPPERDLSETLGVSRGELRKALATLEAEGQVWRHVGKGTFIGSRRVEVMSLSEIDRVTNPAEVMRARLLIEPMLAREAALNATQDHIEAMAACILRTRSAQTWRQYETADNEFHRLIAQATGNRLLLALFDALNAVRRQSCGARCGRGGSGRRTTIIPLPNTTGSPPRSPGATCPARPRRCITTCARSRKS
nr:GntR family transcriptional regulator [Paracoccus sp. PAMC 22219]